jgi:hypothetical protein
MTVLGRIQAFLPQLEASNRTLLERAQADPSSVDIENVKDGEGRYIEMVRRRIQMSSLPSSSD